MSKSLGINNLQTNLQLVETTKFFITIILDDPYLVMENLIVLR